MLRLVVAFCMLLTSLPNFAVERDNGGKGQVLLFPFFTTENGWDTYLNVVLLSVRTDEVLKVRIIDGDDGAVVDTFNVYTKVGENWRAALAQVEPGQPILRVADGSCTIASDGTFGGPGTDFPISTLTGLVEIYRVNVMDARGSRVLEDSTCQELAQRWDLGGSWAEDPMSDLSLDDSQPEIIGHFDLVNVSRGLSSEQPAIGLRDFSQEIAHTDPSSSSPSLLDSNPIARLGSGTLVEPSSGEGIDAVALLLSTQEGSIVNDVVVGSGVAASTDWIVSFPLRGYKSYGENEVEVDGRTLTCNENEIDELAMPFIETRLYFPWASWGGLQLTRGTSVLDPPPVVRYSAFLCYTVNVLSFGTGAPIFLNDDSPLQQFVGLNPGGVEVIEGSFGASYRFSDGFADLESSIGRPVVAYRVTSFVNGTLDGGNVLANYLFMRPHVVN